MLRCGAGSVFFIAASAIGVAAGCREDPKPSPPRPASSAAKGVGSAAPAAEEPSPGGSASAPDSTASADDDFVPDLPDPPPPPEARPDARGPEANRSIIGGYGFPGYPNLDHLCGKRVFEPGGRRTWDAFASEDRPAEVLKHFKRRLSERGLSEERGGGVWRLPPGGPTSRTLSVLPKSEAGPHRACKLAPGPSAKTVVTMTRAH